MRLLTDDERWEIRRLYKDAGITQASLAAGLSCPRQHLNEALQGLRAVPDTFPASVRNTVVRLSAAAAQQPPSAQNEEVRDV